MEEACLLRSDAGEYTIQLLANAPTDTPDGVYDNTLVWIQSVNDDGSWNVKTAPGPAIEDYLNFSVSFDTASMTDGGSMEAVSVFAKATDGDSIYWTAGAGGNPGDVLLVAGYAFAIRVGYAEVPQDVPSQEETEPPETTEPAQPPEDTEPSLPEGGETQEIPSGGMRGSAMGGMSGYGGGAVQTPVFEPFDLTQSTILTVTPGETMTLDITVDELDIGSVNLGQETEVAVAALNGSTVTGTVTGIGTAVNSGGSSKFNVTITLPREENMLSGMSAQASLALDTVENILTVPAAALLDDGSVSYICTGKDEKNGEPNERAAVTTGVSDGETVQILSGLEAGDRYYYSYYDAQDME